MLISQYYYHAFIFVLFVFCGPGSVIWLQATGHAETAGNVPGDRGEETPAERRGLGARDVSQQDPLEVIQLFSRQAAERLKRGDVGEETRFLQNRVLEELNRLLAKGQAGATAKQGEMSPSKSPQPNNNDQIEEEGEESSSRLGTEGNSRPGTARPGAQGQDLQRTLEELWGQLPPRDRPPLTQQAFETFIPKYRRVIESYYRQLAKARREKTPPAAAAKPGGEN